MGGGREGMEKMEKKRKVLERHRKRRANNQHNLYKRESGDNVKEFKIRKKKEERNSICTIYSIKKLDIGSLRELNHILVKPHLLNYIYSNLIYRALGPH